MKIRRQDRAHAGIESPADEAGATRTAVGLADPPISESAFEAFNDLDRARLERAIRQTIDSGADKTELRLGEMLVAWGLITEGQVADALTHQRENGGRFGQVLIDIGALDERALADALAWKFDLAEFDLRNKTPEMEALALLPEEVVRTQLALPVSVSGGVLFVAVVEPSDALRSMLADVAGCEVEVMIAPLNQVRQAIESSYGALGGVSSLVEVFESIEGGRHQAEDTPRTEVVSEDAPVVQVVNRILTQALRDRASDVHIEPQEEIVRVRYRIDGVMKEMLMLPPAMGLGAVNRIKIMSDMNIVERRRPQDGQFTTSIDNKRIDVRVSTIGTIWGEKCVMRILDKTRSILRLESLGMPPALLHEYSEIIRAPFGMVVCAGPTGSGKTTTLYASLNEMNDSSRNIMTIEDPVEYVFSSMNQIQTNEQAGLTFATGLRTILRQDPDIILVGEVRDVETARIAVQSAMTGHLVLSSLHATDTVTALLRFYDMGIESFLVAASVLAVVSQRLVRRMCPACRTGYTPSPEELAYYEAAGGPEKYIFYRGEGCNFCAQTGFQGRLGVYELLPITPLIKRLIISTATDEELRNAASSQGVRTLRQQAVDLVAQDVTTISEVVRSIYSL